MSTFLGETDDDGRTIRDRTRFYILNKGTSLLERISQKQAGISHPKLPLKY
jgi:hypothetical protein